MTAVMTELSGTATEIGKVALITKAVTTLLNKLPTTVHRPLKIIIFSANGI
jgi:hypothetical protein